MKKELKEYFYYTQAERNGIKVLLGLLCLSFLLQWCLPHWFEQETSVDFSSLQAAMTNLEQNATPNSSMLAKQKQTSTTQAAPISLLFKFDPNLASTNEFQKLGLSQKQIKVIENYRNKGGKFFKKEDFKKIYSISAKDYQRLEKFILLPAATAPEVKQPTATVLPTFQKIESFPFDPNTVTKEELQRLGLKDRTITILMNYRAKGASFRKKEDFAKIYGLSLQTFQRLAPYLQFPQASSKPSKKKFEDPIRTAQPLLNKKREQAIDINQASITDWQTLRGIGPTYAKRIVKFRDKLGGFHHKEQLRETYGLPDSTYQSILPFLVNSPIITPLKLNTISLEKLKAHPYISWKQAKGIILYRQNHGTFKAPEELLKIGFVDQAFFDKIKPYIVLE